MNDQPILIDEIKQKLIAWWNGDASPPPSLTLDGYKHRFITWWSGIDLLRASRHFVLPSIKGVRHAQAPHGHRPGISARLRVSQELWGEGNITPGPPAFITEQTARLGLTAEMSMVDLGAGLGGPSRAISSAFGIWVTAYEEGQETAQAGMEQSIMHGMGKRVPIIHVNFATADRPERKFDCFFSKEILHKISIKKRLLAAMELALKPRGQFFIIDYVIRAHAKESPRVLAWMEADDQPSHFWAHEDYAAGFSGAKLELRVTEDLTPRYMEFIAEGFRGLTKKIEGLIKEERDPTMQSDLRRALAYEAHRWAVRAEALQSGDIAVMRFSGISTTQPQIR